MTQFRRPELLKAGSPKGRGLDDLRDRIRQQRRESKAGTLPRVPVDLALITQRGHITRKVCRVGPCLPGLGGIKDVSGGNESIGSSRKKPTSQPHSFLKNCRARPSPGEAPHVKRGHSNISAWREAQKLLMQVLGPSHMRLNSASYMKNDNRTKTGAEKQVTRKSEPSSRNTTLRFSSRNVQESPSKQSSMQPTHTFKLKSQSLSRGADLTFRTPSPSSPGITSLLPRKTPSLSQRRISPPIDKPFRTFNQSNTHSTSPSPIASPIEGPYGKVSVLGKENRGPSNPLESQRHNSKEIRKYMGQQESERRRKEKLKKEEAQQELEKRRVCIEEVLKSQRAALQKARGIAQEKQGVRMSGPDQIKIPSISARISMMQQSVHREVRKPHMKEVPFHEKAGSPVRLPDLGKLQRVEALRKAAAALETRVEKEVAWLGIDKSLNLGRVGPWGDCHDYRGSDSSSTREELPWSEEGTGTKAVEQNLEPTSRGKMTETAALRIGTVYSGSWIADRKGLEAGVTVLGAGQSQEKAKNTHVAHDGTHSSPGVVWSHTNDSADEKGWGAGVSDVEGRVTPESERSDYTDSTSKWSKQSDLFGQGHLLSRLSLAISQQSLREEELRARQHSALCRLREEALWEKTREELAWLEHCKRFLGKEEITLAGITRRKEEVIQMFLQEQAEIHHWQNVYRSGRQQRKLLLRQQKEILDINSSAERIHKNLQYQEATDWAQGQEDPREIPLFPVDSSDNSQSFRQNQPSDSSKTKHSHPKFSPIPQLTVEHKNPKGCFFQEEQWRFQEVYKPQPLCRAFKNKNQKEDATEVCSGVHCLNCGQTYPTLQQEPISACPSQSFHKKLFGPGTFSGLEVIANQRKWERNVNPGGKRVVQCSHTTDQVPDRPTAKSGNTLHMKSKEKKTKVSESSAVLMDSKQHKIQIFLTKTDSGLRKLLSAEDVWSWGKQRNSREVAQDMQQGSGAAPPSHSHTEPTGPYKHQSPQQETPQSGSKEGSSLWQRQTGKTTGLKTHLRAQTDPGTEGVAQIQSHLDMQEKWGRVEKNPNEETSSGDESSSSGGPLRVKSLPNSTEVSWKSHKSAGSFASLPEFHRAVAICVNVSDISVSSSEIEDDLPFDSEDSKWRLTNPVSLNDPEMSTSACPELFSAVADCEKKATRNIVSVSVENIQRSQSASFNKNLECSIKKVGNNQCATLPSFTGADKTDKYGEVGKIMRSEVFTCVTDCQVSGSLVQDREIDNRHESSSGDDGLSETEEKSESFSISSECLASSEEERAFNDGPRTRMRTSTTETDYPRELGDEEAHLSSPEQKHTTHYRAKLGPFNPYPEFSPVLLENHMLNVKPRTNNPRDFVSWKALASEETLSEILSPVDEVLSYGSADLLLSIAGGAGLAMGNPILPPPPPASEIITWTSEEDFPPPPEDLDEPLSDRSPVEDPSIKSGDLPSLNDDMLFTVNKEESAGLLDIGRNYEGLLGNHLMSNSETFFLDKKQGENNTEIGSEHIKSIKVDENEESSDPLSFFHIGDRVLVCHSKPGVLKFKGRTYFAGGHWAGVALDSPHGNHSGTFRGIQYFTCDKNCGVLVRAEDISHLLGEQECDLETRVDDDPFSDEEPPNVAKPEKERGEETKSPSGRPEGSRTGSQEHLMDDYSAPEKPCKGASVLAELNNNRFQLLPSVCDDVRMREISSMSSFVGTGSSMNAQLLEAIDENSMVNVKPVCSTLVPFVDSQRGCKDLGDLCVDKTEPSSISLASIEQYFSHTPQMGSPKENVVQPVPFHISFSHILQTETVGVPSKCIYDLDSLVDRLAGVLVKKVVMDTQEIRRKRSSKNIISQTYDPDVKKREDNNTKANQPFFSDQWHCISTAPQLKVKVQSHDPSIVQTLVGATVETLCGQAVSCMVDVTDAPSYLVDDKSCKTYQRVIIDLTSEIFHEILRDQQKACDYPWETKGTSSFSIPMQSTDSSCDLKAVIQTEVRRVLDLEWTDLQKKEMLLKMCKYGKAHRDRVDYILIQELHKEEPQWVDYSPDQFAVKMRLTEEIFSILLQDTISVLNHINTT